MVKPVKQETDDFQSMCTAVCSTEVDLMTGFCRMGMLEMAASTDQCILVGARGLGV